MSGPASSSKALAAGDRIGPYELISLIGEGGFARVWKARQQEPLVREVALKILKPGMGSAEVLQRFQVEQESLAQMDHPGIARVLGTGRTETGQPYFAMELLADGEPITRYCQSHDLKLSQRLELFLQLCAAIQHAHQAGVIHRDLTPHNVLVAEGVVKVIDFGIAKAVSQDLGLTQSVSLGTTGYMSPEQMHDAQDVDTRSDVYALGVLLQEMVRGQPSARDLVWIIRRCLESDRTRRYATAAALAEDVRRYLEHRPITARPPSVSYLTLKLVRRHRALTVAGLLAGISLGAGIGMALHQADAARAQQQQSQAMTEVLLDSWKGTTADQRKTPTLITMLRGVMTKVSDKGFNGRPVARCRVLLEISEAAGLQMDYQLAYESARHAEALIRETPEMDAGLQVQALMCLGNATLHHESAAKAMPTLRRAWELSQETAGPLAAATLTAQRTLGGAMVTAKDPAAEQMLRDVVSKGHAQHLPADHFDMLTANLDLATVTFHEGRHDEALKLMEQTLADARAGGDMKRSIIVRILLRRGVLLTNVKRYAEAIPAYEEAEVEAKKASIPDTGMVILLRSNRALCYLGIGRMVEAADLMAAVFEEQVRYYGITKRQARNSALRLASAYVQLKRWTELERLLNRVLESVGAGFPYPYHNEHIEALAKHYEATGDVAKAAAWRERAANEVRKGKAAAKGTPP
jgi:non-specific serine/threonine protein kinase/serine/threonine-protein kinase